MEPFFANIKLKTNEEILCLVKEADPVEDCLLISHPIEVEEIDIPGVIQGLKIKHWMKMSRETEFFISGNDIITITEIQGLPVQFYKESLLKLEMNEKKKKQSRSKNYKNSKGKVELNKDMGLIASIDDARELLEEIFLMDTKDNKES